MNSKPKLIRNASSEEAAINRGVADDPDTFVPTDEQFAKMKRRAGRPRSLSPKISLTVRYDSEIIEAFRASGEGWQTKMNDALRDWLRTHRP